MTDMGGYGMGGASAGGSVAALMGREMAPAEARLITRDWKMPPSPPRRPGASLGRD
jgi:hypothetical protein